LYKRKLCELVGDVVQCKNKSTGEEIGIGMLLLSVEDQRKGWQRGTGMRRLLLLFEEENLRSRE
jgi:hypothetical protein